ncbi:MAG TPA: RDD family protein, partial [Pyrinomonadaceae bacterium]
EADAPAMTDNSNVTTHAAQGANNSTRIEFPGVNRNRPAGRTELSERFREIQQRRAREADPEGDDVPRRAAHAQAAPAQEATPAAARAADAASKQLGLVPPQDEPELNPLVAKALRRIERARAAAQPATHHAGGRAQTAAATARVVEERPEPVAEAPAPQPPPLVVVQPKPQPAKAEPPQALKAETAAAPAEVEEPKAPARAPRPAAPQATTSQAVEPQTAEEDAEAQDGSRKPRHIAGVLDEFWLERQGIELLPKVEEKELTYDDRAPRVKRVAAAVVDLFAVAILCAPFAAAIELTISNWGDSRVWGSMALIAALVMFLYHTCSVALAGRTLGMSLCGLQAVDAHKACVPTTGQCMRRAFVYMLSLAAGGLGLLYSLFDAEGRAAHDILSGTVVVRK